MIQDNALAAALAAADEESLTALANKGIYKRACKDTDGLAPEYTEKGSSAEVSIGGETVTVCVPIKDSKCSCPSRTVCRHIIGAVLLLKNEVPEGVQTAAPVQEVTAEKEAEKAPEKKAPSKEEKTNFLSAGKAKGVHECADMCKELLGTVLDKGLVRIPDELPESFELAAVRCHANKMADAERLMRELGGRLDECAQRRASFSPQMFMRRMTDCTEMMNSFCAEKISEDMLGDFRRTYTEYQGTLTLLPIGIRQLTGGEYDGEVYYFLDITDRNAPGFMSISNIMPKFYESTAKRRRAPAFNPWGLAVPLRTMMKSRLTLIRAKTCGGKLSSSQETDIISQSKVSLNCPEIYSMLTDDFRVIAEKLGKCGDDELERLFFVYPESYEYCGFDRHTQTYTMTMRDKNGCRINAEVQYKAETKDLIDTLESIAEKIKKEPEKHFTMLALARIEKGELKLFPIEVYDMIVPLEAPERRLSEEYDDTQDREVYAQVLMTLCDEAEDMLTSIVQFGLCSWTDNYSELVQRCKRFGMAGLEDMLSSLVKNASAYRHKTERNADEILQGMREVMSYIKLCRKKLDTVSALSKMKSHCGEIDF